ncbi:hypothetical protein L596_022950 [Steinernema carpocapsae]|uniref:Uncharacterized protein n=1 Tax=Steinernema carpocapsae TaxID=34508 RepID=A0A4U5MC55_STECR|nr:hypothetical protein L596_022950 [Steinernema carpocapsae]
MRDLCEPQRSKWRVANRACKKSFRLKANENKNTEATKTRRSSVALKKEATDRTNSSPTCQRPPEVQVTNLRQKEALIEKGEG